MAAVALPAPTSRWIVSRRFELGFFFGGAALSVAAALLVLGAGASIVALWWSWLLAFAGPATQAREPGHAVDRGPIMTSTAIAEAMRALVADALAVKLEDVRLDSRLVDDLGADSLDFVDLVFAIEKRFGVKLRDDELDALSQLDFSSPDVMRNGFLAREVIERLTPALPGLRDVPDPDKVMPAAIFGLVSVAVLCAMVERKATSPAR